MTDVSVSSDSEKEEEFKNGDEKGEINKKLEISSLKGKLSNFSEILLKSLKKQLLHKRHSRKSKRSSLEVETKNKTTRPTSAPIFRASSKFFDFRDSKQSEKEFISIINKNSTEQLKEIIRSSQIKNGQILPNSEKSKIMQSSSILPLAQTKPIIREEEIDLNFQGLEFIFLLKKLKFLK